MKRIIIYLLASALPLFSGAQDKPILYCGQPEAWEKLMRRNPSAHDEIERATRELEEWTQAYEANRSGGEQEIYIIPVVFHVIHNNGPENISNDQILNALEILNRDFRMQNTDISLVVDAFQDITADVGIEFRLATKDPQGNCSSGINRIVSELTFQGDDEMKDLIYWPRNRYMNVWICADAAGAAGYTNLPANVAFSWLAPQDGIVIRSDYVGAIGTSNSTRSRALTHEVG
ncbi:MAG: collagenase, partial [Bacteroidota bacterium]